MRWRTQTHYVSTMLLVGLLIVAAAAEEMR